MFSQLFCGLLETSTKDAIHHKEDDLGIKLFKIEILKYQEFVSHFIVFLSDTERNRAEKYHFNKDKNRFIICRTFLKFLLAEHIGSDNDKIILDSDFNKKPYLLSHPSIFFNVTHAGDYAIIAIAESPVGVDIEYINKKFEYEEILSTVFNAIDIEKIRNGNDNHYNFYKLWTRKEAIVKAIGKGIDDDISKIPTTDGVHSVPSALLSNFKNINVFTFDINPEYVGAIAITKSIDNPDSYRDKKIQFYPLPESNDLLRLIKTT